MIRIISLLALVVLSGCAAVDHPSFLLEESSGVIRIGNELLIVSDNDAGVYYHWPLSGSEEGVLSIEPSRVTQTVLAHAEVALDFEGIGMLADGRVVALSERLRALVDNHGIVAEYGGPLAEFGNRGLEGVAVRPLSNGDSRVAVLWEGGYPEYHLVPDQLKPMIERVPLRPVIWVHDLPHGQAKLMVRDTTKGLYALKTIDLEAPIPDHEPPPEGQRFRATDLVWHRLHQGWSQEFGFIVLLNSQNSPLTGKTRYAHLWLQRFTVDGKLIGAPLDLKALLPPDMKERNWEGLA